MSNPFNAFQARSVLRFPPEARVYAFRMSGRRIFIYLANIWQTSFCYLFASCCPQKDRGYGADVAIGTNNRRGALCPGVRNQSE